MPELPEVETICKDLSKSIVDKKIVSVIIRDKRVIKEPDSQQFEKTITGQKINKVFRRAKVIILGLEADNFLIIHLRIAGWLLYGQVDKKSRVSLEFADGTFLNYMDQRVLGELRLVDDYKEFPFIKRLGPEPFDITAGNLGELLKKRKTNIKNLLMNQEIIAGIGNIYAQEALFMSGINPERAAYSLKDSEVKDLHRNIVAVLKEAIKNKGSSIDLYRDIQGNKGGMEECLKIYDKKGQPCCVCKTKIVKISIAGRGTCFCPHCQK
jgi:formamidopyrimidine-DNA glycosylase